MKKAKPHRVRALSEIRRRKPRPKRVNGEMTRNRILNAAEKLFAEHGYSTVSLRSITAEAGVNVAAIHFHFASKEALFEALFNRRVEPINERRMSGLQATVERAINGPPEIEDVISAFVRPHLESAGGFDAGKIVLLRFIARAAAEQDRSIQSVLRNKFDPPWKMLVAAAKKALPEATDEAINWGLFFLLGSLYFVNPSRVWFSKLSHGKCDAADTNAALHYLLPFLAGGLRALALAEKGASHNKMTLWDLSLRQSRKDRAGINTTSQDKPVAPDRRRAIRRLSPSA